VWRCLQHCRVRGTTMYCACCMCVLLCFHLFVSLPLRICWVSSKKWRTDLNFCYRRSYCRRFPILSCWLYVRHTGCRDPRPFSFSFLLQIQTCGWVYILGPSECLNARFRGLRFALHEVGIPARRREWNGTFPKIPAVLAFLCVAHLHMSAKLLNADTWA
jgi:hypothetical protein